MIGKITKSTVERLPLNALLWDTSLVGFGARRQLRHVHYLLRYRINGYQKFISIGRHGMWTPETARNEAKRLLGSVARGIDPASERARRADTFGAEVERYLNSKRSSLKARSITEIHRHLVVYAKPLHPLPLGKIDRRTIALRLGEIEQASGGPSRNRFRSSLSAFFAWAIREGLTEFNPVTGTGKANEGSGRDRVLSEAELGAVLKALGDDDFNDMVRLLIFTAQRREEIGGLHWSEVDWDRGLIVLPPERTKNKRQHELPISKQVDDILSRRWVKRNASRIERRGLPSDVDSTHRPHGRGDGGWVWGRRFTAWSKSKEILDRRLNGMGAWRLHDLRRSAATHMAELGVLPHITEAILNHYSGHRAGVAGVYQRAKYSDEMRSALQRYADWLDKITA